MTEKPFFEVEGVFYTYDDGGLLGYACTHGDYWKIVTDSGEDLLRYTLFLDRDRRVLGPKNNYQKKESLQRIEDFLVKYQKKVDELSVDVNLLKMESFRMKLYIAETKLVEYKSLKYSYFCGNALKFILFE